MAVAPRIHYQAVAGYKDHATRNSSLRWNVSAGNAAAWETDTTAGALFAAFAALDGMTLDDPQLRRVARYADDTGVTPGSSPLSESAVNSAKLLVLLVDTVTGSKFSAQIPARDPAAYTSVRGLVIIDPALRSAQVTALFDNWSPTVLSEDGNASSIYEIRVIGKGTAA